MMCHLEQADRATAIGRLSHLQITAVIQDLLQKVLNRENVVHVFSRRHTLIMPIEWVLEDIKDMFVLGFMTES